MKLSTVLSYIGSKLPIEIRLVLCFSFSFLVSLVITKYIIKFCELAGLVGKDRHKLYEVKVAEFSAPAFIISLTISVALFSIFFKGYYLEITIGSLVPLLVAVILLIEDLTILISKKEEKKVGIPKILKVLSPILASYPLVVHTWFHLKQYSTIFIPFFGKIDFDAFYPLVLVPLAIIGTANAANMLEGLNGLGIGLIIITLSFQTFVLAILGKLGATILGFIFISVLLGFLYWNLYPARIFPGDALMYAAGSAIAVLAILGKIEVYSTLLFLIWFLEASIKFYRRFVTDKKWPECFGIPYLDEKGVTRIKAPEKIGSLTHIVMKILRNKGSELSIVLTFYLIQAAYCALITFLFFKFNLF